MTTRNARLIYDQPLTINDLKPLAGLCTQEFQWPVYLSGESVFYVIFIYLGYDNANYLHKSQLHSKQPIDNINDVGYQSLYRYLTVKLSESTIDRVLLLSATLTSLFLNYWHQYD